MCTYIPFEGMRVMNISISILFYTQVQFTAFTFTIRRFFTMEQKKKLVIFHVYLQQFIYDTVSGVLRAMQKTFPRADNDINILHELYFNVDKVRGRSIHSLFIDTSTYEIHANKRTYEVIIRILSNSECLVICVALIFRLFLEQYDTQLLVSKVNKLNTLKAP